LNGNTTKESSPKERENMNPFKSPRTGQRRRIFLTSGLVPTLTFVLITGILFFQQYDTRRTEQLADDFRAPLSYVTSVDEVAWSWQPPRQMAMRDIRPMAAGLVVTHAGGLVAIDGGSGNEIWDHEFPQESSAAVTPDRLKAVYAPPTTGGGKGKEITVLDSVSGRQFSQHDVPGEVFVHHRLLTSTHLLFAHDGEAGALFLASGERSWSYRTPSGCLDLPGFDPENDCQWPVAAHTDLVFIPQVCSGSGGQKPGPYPVDVSLNVVALEAATGEPVWSSEDIPLEGYSHEGGDIPYPVRLMSSGDMQTLILRSPQGFYALDAGDGGILSGDGPLAIESGLFEDHLVYAGSEFFVSHRPEPPVDGEVVYVKSSYDGEAVEEIRVPEDIHPPVDPPWTPAPRIAVLGEGIVLFSCGDGLDCEADSVPLEIHFFPWGDGDPSEVRFQDGSPDLSGSYLRSSLLPVPGAVIAYQRWPAGYPVGAVFGLV
jgi:hypothetical protein